MDMWPGDACTRLGPILNHKPEVGDDPELFPSAPRNSITKIFAEGIWVVDLKTRRIVWQKPLGTSVDIGPLGIASHIPLPMGVPSFGGSMTTGGGLIFIGGSQEKRFRALDLRTGRQLWSRRLPAGGNANPTTYISPESGRQFVVIAAGGSIVLGSGSSDQFVAYALPKRK